jgi:hypothetical protein
MTLVVEPTSPQYDVPRNPYRIPMEVRKIKPPIIKPPKNSGNPSDLGAKKAATSATMLATRHQINH